MILPDGMETRFKVQQDKLMVNWLLKIVCKADIFTISPLLLALTKD